jgi:predicted ATPase
LPEDAWERRHELTFALALHRGECEFLTGALAQAEQRLEALSSRTASTVERATVAGLRADLYTTLDQGSRAIAVGLDYLRHLGIDWSPHPTEEEMRHEYERIWSQLGGRAIEALIDLPLMSDAASLATLDVLTKLVAPAFYTDGNLLALITCRAVNLSLERGNCDGSCFAYVLLGSFGGPRFGDYQAGYRFGRLGYDLVEGRGLKRFQARTYMDFGNVVLPWTKHIRTGRDLVLRAFESATKVGDVTYAAFCGNQLTTNLLAAGDPLDDAQRQAENGLAFAQKARFGSVIDRMTAQLALQLHCPDGSESMGDHDSGFDDWWCVGRRYADAVGFFVARGQATDSSAFYAGAGRDLGGAVSRWTVGQRTAQDGLDAGGNGRR